MMRKNDGGPAHPVCTGNPDHWQKGMSLRDWFAGQVISGNFGHLPMGPIEKAKVAYAMADAMIAERAKG
jgi:hypothetical protein